MKKERYFKLSEKDAAVLHLALISFENDIKERLNNKSCSEKDLYTLLYKCWALQSDIDTFLS